MNLAEIRELSIDGVKLRELSVDGTKIWQAGRLPAGYTEVEWIESTGTQYIDTGIKASDYPGGITYIFTVTIMSHASFSYLMGALASSTRSGNVTVAENGKLSIACGGNNNTLYTTPFTDGEMMNIRLDTVTAADPTVMSCYTNDVEWDAAYGGGVSSAMPNANIYFLKCNGSNRVGASCKTYSFVMTNVANGNTIKELIPCTNPSGIVGMYDMVGGTFHVNAGTGAFTAGPAV